MKRIVIPAPPKRKSIFHPDNTNELRTYTMNLFNILESHGCLMPCAFSTFMDCVVNANLHVDGDDPDDNKEELEYLLWNKNEYLYSRKDLSLYTYEQKPKKIGYFDYNNMTAIIV